MKAPYKTIQTATSVVRDLNNLYEIVKPTKLAIKEVFSRKKPNFIEKVNYLKNLDASKLSISFRLKNTFILERILFDVMNIEKKIDIVDIKEFDTKFEILFDYLQHVLRCVYFRLDKFGTRLLMHYSPVTTYSRTWNNFTRSARGLVVDLKTKTLVVHPYDKFHNFREVPETQEANLPNLPYEDAEKLDGSEGIMYPDVDGSIRIITKGGFDTTQGQFATKMLNTKYVHIVKDTQKIRELLDQYTLIFEILYSDDDMNRVVVKYGSEPDLRLIGVRDLFNGETFTYAKVQEFAAQLGFPSIKTETMTLDQMLVEKTKRTNFEGWVRRYSNGLYMKIKCDEYLENHGARFGTSEKAVFNLVKDDKWDDFIANVPEEFREISNGMYKKIMAYVATKEMEINTAYKGIPLIADQKEFAKYVQTNIKLEYQGFMYHLRAGKELNCVKSATSWPKFRDRMTEDLKEKQQ